ncbi:MAG: hypothetical protein ACREX9_19670 [Gammaproteobacteria bacterium]
MNLFLVDETWLFTAAIGLMLGLAVIEALGMLLGHGGLSAWIDHFMPHTPAGMVCWAGCIWAKSPS